MHYKGSNRGRRKKRPSVCFLFFLLRRDLFESCSQVDALSLPIGVRDPVDYECRNDCKRHCGVGDILDQDAHAWKCSYGGRRCWVSVEQSSGHTQEPEHMYKMSTHN